MVKRAPEGPARLGESFGLCQAHEAKQVRVFNEFVELATLIASLAPHRKGTESKFQKSKDIRSRHDAPFLKERDHSARRPHRVIARVR
jgi:hypothetical protein